jgi:uncharacterized protein YoxC
MRPAPRVEPWVMKLLTATLVVIALALVAIAILLILGLGQLADLIETMERLESTLAVVAGDGSPMEPR